ncbi:MULTISPECIES: hypothetical protein [unclassified Arsukibacterium]|uniref:hypothetical protein n=1 Tax=unclassified Arsukibacterium TaxID=2635278 RepID=UPI000C41B6C7|nr:MULTISPECIES: hypothetical protein [unclassified Arsukibacterium]MAA95966.1 hypothetical protein [Rheinheimera sp.]MBM33444.1 hypothetical protein [Rheinheimera sp.]HAW91824.1 hypothetical protein [Candidatus Azambacteria bacterium]
MSIFLKPYVWLVVGVLSLSFQVTAVTVQFNSDRNSACWQVIEQRKPGFCRLYFQFTGTKPDSVYADQASLSNSMSDYPVKRSSYPTSFQQLEYALQFFQYSAQRFKIRNNLVFIRSDNGAVQLNMGILTSASGGYSYLLADNDNQIKQLIADLQKTDPQSTRYQRSIEQLFQN